MAIKIPIISEFDSKGLDKAVKEFQSLEGAGAKAGYAVAADATRGQVQHLSKTGLAKRFKYAQISGRN